jgi:hypothetical protein
MLSFSPVEPPLAHSLFQWQLHLRKLFAAIEQKGRLLEGIYRVSASTQRIAEIKVRPGCLFDRAIIISQLLVSDRHLGWCLFFFRAHNHSNLLLLCLSKFPHQQHTFLHILVNSSHLPQTLLATNPLADLTHLDMHELTGTVKAILRSMEPPLLTYELYEKFLSGLSLKEEHRLSALLETMGRLPKPHRRGLEFLIRHLRK